MRKLFSYLPIQFILLLLLPGCSAIGDKAGSLVWIYGLTAVLSLLLLVAYCALVSKKDIWFLLLFSCVLIVNIGYFALSISKSLEEALLANRISYLGSVFLPLAMLMIILNAIGLHCRKWMMSLLLIISIFVFFVAASPGYLPIYYREVTFVVIGGVSTLQKVYGSWHCLYLYYLLAYFTAMLGIIAYATVKKKIAAYPYILALLMAVLINLGVWLIEQLVQINFEILSFSYIICELFLMIAHLIATDAASKKAVPVQQEAAPIEEEIPAELPSQDEQTACFLAGLSELTPTERTIYEAYITGAGTKDVLQMLDIKENTLKFHNKNIYGKLGISSRKQLMEIYRRLKADDQYPQ